MREPSSIVDQATAVQETYNDAIEQSKQYGLDNTAALNEAEEQALAIVRKSGVEQIQALATQISDRFQIVSGGAQATANQAVDNFDIQAQQQRTELTKVQPGERLDIIKKYGDAANAATAANLKTAQGNVANLFNSLGNYAQKLQTGSDSPLSPLSQYDLAKSQFQAVSGAAAAGDFNSASQLSSYADAFLGASRGIYGSGASYAADFSQVLSALQSVSQVSDALTASDMRTIAQDSAATIAGAKRRALDVAAILDKTQDRRASNRSRYTSATYLANAGVPVWIDGKPAIAHNRVVVLDATAQRSRPGSAGIGKDRQLASRAFRAEWGMCNRVRSITRSCTWQFLRR